VAPFAGGVEFLASLDTTHPSCVLLDAKMPGMDGREVLARLTRRPERIPVIVVSGHAIP
jgi:FixJ family two-component response regulator